VYLFPTQTYIVFKSTGGTGEASEKRRSVPLALRSELWHRGEQEIGLLLPDRA